ncbi:MAG: hypothetical protein JHC93_04630 [Parachlamydiales bacterium]|nr:hypothetical protein [Parachlamydiales bacterium]
MTILDIKGECPPIICFHGYGGSKELAAKLKNGLNLPNRFVGFDFPDAGLMEGGKEAHEMAFGSFNELVPPLQILKQIIQEERCQEVVLYGRSAGGGALINTIAVLNNKMHTDKLLNIGIDEETVKSILEVIQNGSILLDCPLKTIEEIIDLRGPNKELLFLNHRYKLNEMLPLDQIKYLVGLKLNIILHFLDPDDVIYNRDDTIFYERLKTANSKGETHLVVGNEGLHGDIIHQQLWDKFKIL